MGVIAEGFAAFAQPLIDATDGSEEQLHNAFAMAQLCFNLALLPKGSRDQTLDEMRADFPMNDEEFQNFRTDVVLPMIRRHELMFPGMHGRVGTTSSRAVRSPHVQAGLTTPAPKLSTIDRYAPCSCNSGKKYKFCCGSKD